jgi:hypothetical protein
MLFRKWVSFTCSSIRDYHVKQISKHNVSILDHSRIFPLGGWGQQSKFLSLSWLSHLPLFQILSLIEKESEQSENTWRFPQFIPFLPIQFFTSISMWQQNIVFIKRTTMMRSYLFVNGKEFISFLTENVLSNLRLHFLNIYWMKCGSVLCWGYPLLQRSNHVIWVYICDVLLEISNSILFFFYRRLIIKRNSFTEFRLLLDK